MCKRIVLEDSGSGEEFFLQAEVENGRFTIRIRQGMLKLLFAILTLLAAWAGHSQLVDWVSRFLH